jgi:hypothetical protein
MGQVIPQSSFDRTHDVTPIPADYRLDEMTQSLDAQYVED